MFKKISSLLVIGVITFSLTACGKKASVQPASESKDVGINVNVSDKPETKSSDSKDVNIGVKVAPTK
jgi:predicted small lipoprotein YifL